MKDKSIGLGLSCSHSIVTTLGGNIHLKQSQPNLTVFGFEFPIRINNDSRPNRSNNPEKLSMVKRDVTEITELRSSLMVEYLQERGLQDL